MGRVQRVVVGDDARGRSAAWDDAASVAHLASIYSRSHRIVDACYDSLVLHPSLANVSGRSRSARPTATADRSPVQTDAVTREQVLAEQAAFINRLSRVAPSAKSSRRVQLALNAIVMDVDAADLPQLARDTAITRIVGVSDYAHDLSETVPYIGATTAHCSARGQGVRVAVIDSGIDYTHAALGGPGTQAATKRRGRRCPRRGSGHSRWSRGHRLSSGRRPGHHR